MYTEQNSVSVFTGLCVYMCVCSSMCVCVSGLKETEICSLNFYFCKCVCVCVCVCVLHFVGGEPHTAGLRQVSVALIRARLHMDLIGREIIIYWGENQGEVKEGSKGKRIKGKNSRRMSLHPVQIMPSSLE